MSSVDESRVTGPAAKPEPLVPVTPAKDEPKSGRQFAGRDDVLSAAGKFAEAEHFVEGIGWLILSEISGEARARITGESAMALNNGRLEVGKYQLGLMLEGIVDPASPEGQRRPLFAKADTDRLMKLGGAKIEDICDVIQKLSNMGPYSGRAEGDSESTPNGDSTSG